MATEVDVSLTLFRSGAHCEGRNRGEPISSKNLSNTVKNVSKCNKGYAGAAVTQ